LPPFSSFPFLYSLPKQKAREHDATNHFFDRTSPLTILLEQIDHTDGSVHTILLISVKVLQKHGKEKEDEERRKIY
jgi:hypothetical protein